MSNHKVLVVVHGGASKITNGREDIKMCGVKDAAVAAYKVLSKNGTSVTAVEAAVNVMEDLPDFNAGYGSSLSIAGTVEMDALLMRGSDMAAGAVTGVTKVARPITLARMIMENDPDHIYYMGEGAHRFATKMGIPLIDPMSLITDMAKERLELHKSFKRTITESVNNPTVGKVEGEHDTVGAVAIDFEGHCASATSTGGLTGKQEYRISDTSLIGAGGWAKDGCVGCDPSLQFPPPGVAVSTTGHGEAIMKTCLARRIAEYIEQGSTPQEAGDKSLEFMRRSVNSCSGAIVLDSTGRVGVSYTTEHMPWAYVDSEAVLHFGFAPGQHNRQQL